MQRNTVRVIPCESWEDFTKQVRPIRKEGDRIFRGQRTCSVEWRLESQWERLLSSSFELVGSPVSFQETRDRYVKRFKHLMRGLDPPLDPKEDDREWWALGRQHGLVTPLLDWTRSPYVAAYFAFVDYTEKRNPGFRQGQGEAGLVHGTPDCPTEPVAVWELYVDEKLIDGPGEFDVFSSRNQWTARRELAQQGCFTWLTHDTHIDLESYLKSREMAHLLRRYEIPGDELAKALRDTHLMNINQATLFPDADGAARHANYFSQRYRAESPAAKGSG